MHSRELQKTIINCIFHKDRRKDVNVFTIKMIMYLCTKTSHGTPKTCIILMFYVSVKMINLIKS
jgi:hypothetical protein